MQKIITNLCSCVCRFKEFNVLDNSVLKKKTLDCLKIKPPLSIFLPSSMNCGEMNAYDCRSNVCHLSRLIKGDDAIVVTQATLGKPVQYLVSLRTSQGLCHQGLFMDEI